MSARWWTVAEEKDDEKQQYRDGRKETGAFA